MDEIKEKIGQSTATLLYGAKDVEHNHAIVLMDFITRQ
ncbi:uncharacterized protein YeaO (DUF488 family) [Rhizobium sp. BK312]|nr:uncharacterized protein YeaO (DUF488 family) [Rhizobium sp. BK312]